MAKQLVKHRKRPTRARTSRLSRLSQHVGRRRQGSHRNASEGWTHRCGEGGGGGVVVGAKEAVSRIGRSTRAQPLLGDSETPAATATGVILRPRIAHSTALDPGLEAAGEQRASSGRPAPACRAGLRLAPLLGDVVSVLSWDAPGMATIAPEPATPRVEDPLEHENISGRQPGTCP